MKVDLPASVRQGSRKHLPEIGLGLLLGLGLLSAIQPVRLSVNDLTLLTRQVRCVSKALPQEQGEVGYLVQPETTNADLQTDGNRIFESMAFQYLLAPRRIVPGSRLEWVVANLDNPALLAEAQQVNGLTLVSDCGGGVALLRRAGKR